MNAYTEKVDFVFEEGKALVDEGRLDRADVDGIDKTTNALSQRWNSVNLNLAERKKRQVNDECLKIMEQSSGGPCPFLNISFVNFFLVVLFFFILLQGWKES